MKVYFPILNNGDPSLAWWERLPTIQLKTTQKNFFHQVLENLISVQASNAETQSSHL